MPRRSAVSLDEVASMDTLSWALWRTARGRRGGVPDRSVVDAPVRWLADLGQDLRAGHAPEGRFHTFEIRDPKPRQISAPCFRDRVVHHALMAHVGPVLDRSLVADTFACRTGKGSLAAVQRAQHYLRRHPWFVKVDVATYFRSIDHLRLMALLKRKFKHPELLELCSRILERSPHGPEQRGLPIGALTSQHFANLYLDGLDRWLLADGRVRGIVRYLDDVLWWCDDRTAARQTLRSAAAWVRAERYLELKPSWQVGRSVHGVSFLGFRICQGRLGLLRRRRRRYTAARAAAERAFREGSIDAQGLQSAVDAALSITAHADARAWRRAELSRRQPVEA